MMEWVLCSSDEWMEICFRFAFRGVRSMIASLWVDVGGEVKESTKKNARAGGCEERKEHPVGLLPL